MTEKNKTSSNCISRLTRKSPIHLKDNHSILAVTVISVLLANDSFPPQRMSSLTLTACTRYFTYTHTVLCQQRYSDALCVTQRMVSGIKKRRQGCVQKSAALLPQPVPLFLHLSGPLNSRDSSPGISAKGFFLICKEVILCR